LLSLFVQVSFSRPAVREAEHDASGNGQLDPGEITASVDQFRVSCP